MSIKATSPFKTILKSMLWTIGLTLLSLISILGILVIILLNDPIDLTDYKGFVRKAFKIVLPQSKLRFETAILKWDQEQLAFIIESTNARLRSRKRRHFFRIEDIKAIFPAYRLLFLNFYPKAIQIDHLKGKLKKRQRKSEISDEDVDQSPLLADIQEAIGQSGVGQVILTNAKIKFKSKTLGKWKLKNLNIVFQRNGLNIEGAFFVNVNPFGKVSGTLYSREGKPQKIEIALKDLNPKTVFAHKNFKRTQFGRLAKKHSRGIDIPLSGVLTMYLDEEVDIKRYKIFLSSKKGLIQYVPYTPKPLQLSDAEIKLNYQNDKLVIEHLSINASKFQAIAAGTFDFKYDETELESVDFKIQGEATRLKLDDLDSLWPKQLATIPRQWVRKNIPSGDLTKATITFEGNHDIDEDSLTIDKLEGDLLPSRVTVFYLDGLPPVVDAAAEITFDQKQMNFIFKSGHTTSQTLESGSARITGLDKESQHMLINLNLQGSNADALEIMDVPRLKYAQKYGLTPNQVKGQAETKLHFEFPLSLSTTLEKVVFSAESKLSDVSIEKLMTSPEISLTNGELNIKVKNEGLSIKGKGSLNGAPSTFQLDEPFGENKAHNRTLSVACTVDDEFFQRTKIIPKNNLQGECPITLTYKEATPQNNILELKGDLKDIRLDIPELRIHKPRGEPGKLDAEINMAEGKLKKISSLNIDCGPNLVFNAEAEFTEKNVRLQSLQINKFQTQKDHFSGHIHRSTSGIYQANLKGTYFDIDSLIENREDVENSFLTQIPFSLTFSIDEAAIKGSPFLRSVKGQLKQSNKGFVESLNLNAFLAQHAQSNQHCKITLNTQGKTQTLTMRLDDLGSALKPFVEASDLRGGRTDIKAQRVPGPTPSPWKGSYQINNFEIIKAPLLARLLKIASPLGFVDMFSKGQGLKFSYLKGSFSINPNSIELGKSYAVGPSVGLTLWGTINLKDALLDLQGTIIPAYIFNSMISYIPIIGQLLTGGTGEGMFAISFSITGSPDTPTIQVNPLSAVTPGILRKMFEGSRPKSLEPKENRK